MVSSERVNQSRTMRRLMTAATAVLSAASLLAFAVAALLPLLEGRYQSLQGWSQAFASLLPAGPANTAIAVLLGISFVVFLALTRWQISQNPYLKNSWGCPHCSEHTLLRIQRTRIQRLASRLFFLNSGHFICEACAWDGMRMIGYSPHRQTVLDAGKQKQITELKRAPDAELRDKAALPTTPHRQGMQPDSTPRTVPQTQMTTMATLSTSAFELPPENSAALPAWIDTIGRYSERSYFIAIFYFATLTLAETIAVTISPVTGVLLHILILFTLAFHAALTWNRPVHRFLLSLMLIPLIRIVSLALPLTDFKLTYWYFIVSIPLFGAAYVVMRELKFTLLEAIGFSWRELPVQLLIGAGGILFGLTEYLILRPEPLIDSFSWAQFWIPALILLLSTGFLEEYIFRFLIQRTAIDQLGIFSGITYVALLFAVLHIGYHSVADFIFVFAVGWLFGGLAHLTRSILGVTIAHGVTNICLFLIFPFVFTGEAQAAPDLQAAFHLAFELDVTSQIAELESIEISAQLPEVLLQPIPAEFFGAFTHDKQFIWHRPMDGVRLPPLESRLSGKKEPYDLIASQGAY